MMEVVELQKFVEEVLPGSQVEVKDLTGTADHFKVEIALEAFRGKMLIDQHRLVQSPLEPMIKDGRIHALSIKTYLPEDWQSRATN